MKHPTAAQQLHVIARSPFHIYYEGEAERVSAVNAVGPFDLLPGHADFFSIMTPGEVTIETKPDTEPITFKISNGIATVQDGQVMLFVNI